MKIIIIYFIIGIVISLPNSIHGQDLVRTLSVGDSLPDFEITKLFNENTSHLRTSDFQDKLMIIDFWSTRCSGCVMGLAKLDKLQKSYGSKIKILPVTYEKEDQVIPFWRKNKYTKNLSIPTVMEDTRFHNLFKHSSIPHEVWIYHNVVVGITSDEYVDQNNIDMVLTGKQVKWPIKYDFYNYDYSHPIFTADTSKINNSTAFLKYIGLTPYKKGINSSGFSGGSGIIRDKTNRTIRAYALNEPLYVFYVLRWNKLMSMQNLLKPEEDLKPNQVVWEVKDRSKYRFIKALGYTQSWLLQHGICFESLTTDTGQTDKDIYFSMIKDMNHLMGLEVGWQKRKEVVWVLKNIKTIKTRYTNLQNGLSIWSLLEKWSLQEDHPYVFNESGIVSNDNLNIKVNDSEDLDKINEDLKYFGLEITKELRTVDKFIFTEIRGSAK